MPLHQLTLPCLFCRHSIQVTRLDKDIQLTLIEHMAHLTSADYDEIPRDLLLLGFIPEEKADLIEDSGVVDVLADIYGAWTKGGGAAAINVNEVVAQLQDLTATRGNMFSVPAYFLLIAKAFSGNFSPVSFYEGKLSDLTLLHVIFLCLLHSTGGHRFDKRSQLFHHQ